MATQVLGILGDIANAIGNAFSGIANWISDKIGEWLDYFMVVILKLVYEILKIFFMLLDFIQLVFRKMAGLDTVYYNGTEVTGDLALVFFRNENVVNALIALTVTAFVMVFVATFIAIIRNHWTARESKDTAVAPVIGKAFKAMFAFIFVPLVCYFGVYVSNGLLKTVDQATRISDSTTISGQVFAASAMNSNRARIDASFAEKLKTDSSLNFNGTFVDDNNTQYVNSKTAAEKIDDAFAIKLAANGHNIVASYDDGYKFMFHQASPGAISNFDYMNTDLVFVYYDFLKFNWLFAFASCFFIMAALLVASLGVIQRLFEITLLFAISPPFVALMPLDNGKAFGMWTKKFIESTVIMYGTVVALNFFFIIAPVLQSIDLFGSPEEIATYGQLTCDLFNAIAHILFIMCGSLMIKDASTLITQLVAANDKAPSLTDKGSAVQGAIQGNMAKAAKTVGAVKGATSGIKSKINDHYSAENVAKRQQAKAQKQQDKQVKQDRKAEDRARRRTVMAGVRSGELGLREADRLNRALRDGQRAERGEKLSLRTRAHEKYDSLTGKVTDQLSPQGFEKLDRLNTAINDRAEAHKSGAVAKAKASQGKIHFVKAYKAGRAVSTSSTKKYYTNGRTNITNEQKDNEKLKKVMDNAEQSIKNNPWGNSTYVPGHGIMDQKDIDKTRAKSQAKADKSLKDQKNNSFKKKK